MANYKSLRFLKKCIILPLVMMLTTLPGITFGEDLTEPDLWGLAIGIRTASIPFATETDWVNDIIPLIIFSLNHRLS